MKNLIIVRHAKSSWADLSITDKQRTLSSRGNRDAPIMSQKLLDLGVKPEVALVSPSQRTRETVAHFAQHDFSKVDFVEELYHPTDEALIEACFSVESTVDSVIVFSHNPAVTIFANEVCDTYIDNVPTCGILICSADVSNWQDLDYSKLRLDKFIFPKMYGLT